MDSGDRVGAVFFVCLTVFLMGLIVSIYKYNVNENDSIVQMVKEGYSPIEAQCAFDNYGDAPVCVLIASGVAPKEITED